MKRMTLLLWMASLVCLFMTSCDDDDKQAFEVASLSGLSSESGPGNVLLKWDKIESDGVAYVEIVYNAGDETGKKVLVNGQFLEKLIYGFGDENTYTFTVSVCMTDGRKSSAQTIEATPEEPAFFDLQRTLKVTNSFLGGIDLKWNNLSDDKFYINVEYTSLDGTRKLLEVDVTEKGLGEQFVKVTGLVSADMGISVSDIVGNTSAPQIFAFKILEKGKFDRSIWRIPDFSSQHNTGVYAVSNVLNGQSSFWHAHIGTSRFPHHITLDLTRKVKITTVELHSAAHQKSTKDIVVYGSNGSYTDLGPWSEIVKIEMPDKTYHIEITELEQPVEYRYVKVVMETPGTYNPLYASLGEIILYGEDIIE